MRNKKFFKKLRTMYESPLKKYLLIFFLIIISIKPFSAIYNNRNGFMSQDYWENFDHLSKSYSSSQYVKKVNPNPIPDQAFEGYVSGAFVRGTNPIHIVHEHPPLGRYIIGLSIVLFNNDSTIILPLMFLSLLGIFLISKMIIQNTFFSLIPLAIFANEPLLISKFEIVPLLEPIQLTFIIFTLYFFIKGITEEKYKLYFILSSITLGFVISIRFFILGAALETGILLYLLLRKKTDRKLFFYITCLPLSLIVLILAYMKTIQEGYSILQVFSIQKYILFYHKSKLISFFSFWDLLMFNRWHTWWADRRIISDSVWFFFWPISMALSFLYVFLALLKKIRIKEEEKIIILWIVSYCVLLSVGDSTTRYFLPLVPFLYIIAISFTVKLFKIFFNTK